MWLRPRALFCRQGAQIPCAVPFFRQVRERAPACQSAPRVRRGCSRKAFSGQILVRSASLFAFFSLCAFNAFVCVRMHICCAVCKFSRVHCVSLACLRARAHAETPCGVQVFVCALCVLMCVVFVWVRVRMRKLPAVCKFLCVHCVSCCVW